MFRNLFLLVSLVAATRGVTQYEYFDDGSVLSKGLLAEGDTFTLNDKDLLIVSGALHYFRVHPDYWRITLRKMKAAGLNTIETYVPWNLHNPRIGVYDFGDLGEDMSPFLDLKTFIKLIQEEDMFLLLRPGPYICTEWDFGGLPSWLLRDPAMKVRSSYSGFTEPFAKYFAQLVPLIHDQQFTEGGPIIAMQIENEFGHFGYEDYPRDTPYMEWIRDLFDQNGFSKTLYFTSDSPGLTSDLGAVPGVLQTANFQVDAEKHFDLLLQLQPNRPLMVMEFWTGWFDHWLAKQHITFTTPDEMEDVLETIFSYNSSVNFYMFIGGTNFGFLAGANVGGDWPSYSPDTTSYDYDAPLTEAGDYNEKYNRAAKVIRERDPLFAQIDRPPRQAVSNKGKPGTFDVEKQLVFEAMIDQSPVSIPLTDGPINMEALDMNDGSGQSFGYILYSTTVDLPKGTSTILIRGHVRDMAQVLVNGKLVTKPFDPLTGLEAFGFWDARDATLDFETKGGPTEIQILVENLGRVNFGKPHVFDQRKGLYEGAVYVNMNILKEWTATPFEFQSTYVNALTDWEPYTGSLAGPSAYKMTYTIVGSPMDVWLDMSEWQKGCVFVNGFNLGRYWLVQAPVKTMYLPAPLLHEGINEVIIFEQYKPASKLTVTDKPFFTTEAPVAATN